jgi:hypothetical protein
MREEIVMFFSCYFDGLRELPKDLKGYSSISGRNLNLAPPEQNARRINI